MGTLPNSKHELTTMDEQATVLVAALDMAEAAYESASLLYQTLVNIHATTGEVSLRACRQQQNTLRAAYDAFQRADVKVFRHAMAQRFGPKGLSPRVRSTMALRA